MEPADVSEAQDHLEDHPEDPSSLAREMFEEFALIGEGVELDCGNRRVQILQSVKDTGQNGPGDERDTIIASGCIEISSDGHTVIVYSSPNGELTYGVDEVACRAEGEIGRALSKLFREVIDDRKQELAGKWMRIENEEIGKKRQIVNALLGM